MIGVLRFEPRTNANQHNRKSFNSILSTVTVFSMRMHFLFPYTFVVKIYLISHNANEGIRTSWSSLLMSFSFILIYLCPFSICFFYYVPLFHFSLLIRNNLESPFHIQNYFNLTFSPSGPSHCYHFQRFPL